MSRFATPGHLLSWACLCSRNDESAGNRRSTRLRLGGKWQLLQAQFHRIRTRRGAKKAIIAVAASMLTTAWHMNRHTALIIEDLSLGQLLDREAACAVQGGIDAFQIEPDGGTGGAPVPLPWPLPAFPLLPVSGWSGTPVPQGPRVPISTPADRTLLR